MNIPRSVLLAAALSCVALTVAAQDAVLEIRGLRIGMTQDEVVEMYPNWADFTVAGTRAKFPNMPVTIKYHENKLDQFTYFFASDGFDSLMSAFKEKYPALSCKNSKIGNAMGATYEQIQCDLTDSNSVIRMSKYVSDSRTSLLSLNSKRIVDEMLKKHREKKKDI